MQLGQVQHKVNEYEKQIFANKKHAERLRNEIEQVVVDLSYARATTEN